MPLAQVKEGTERGTLDVTLAVSPTPERGKTLFFSQGTVAFTLSLFARKEAQDIHGLDSLAGKTLATYPGYSWNVRYPDTLPDTRILPVGDVEAMFRAVATGQADAAISETESGKALLRRSLLTNVEPKAVAAFDGLQSRPGHYYGVSRRLPVLASILDKSFAAMSAAEKQRIWERWFARGEGSGAVDLNARERAYLDGMVLRRALASAWAPFDFADADGAPTGVAEDYWALIRDKLGLHEALGERLPFSANLTAIEQGERDLFAATTRTPDRERFALFSHPYERYPIAIAGRAAAGLFFGTASLTGLRVAVGREYSAYHLLKAHSPGIDFVLVDDTRAALEAVAAGRADAAKLRYWLDTAPDAWRVMARIFVAEYPEAANAIGAALDAGDRTRAGEVLHRLRGAAGALGADALTAAAERLELALAKDGTVDAGLRADFFASTEATLAVLAGLMIPTVRAASVEDAEPGRGEPRQRLRELEALLEAGNTRALDHLPWLEGWVGAEAPREGRELLWRIEVLSD